MLTNKKLTKSGKWKFLKHRWGFDKHRRVSQIIPSIFPIYFSLVSSNLSTDSLSTKVMQSLKYKERRKKDHFGGLHETSIYLVLL